MTEKEIYDYYQERSMAAGDRGSQLAWMFILPLCFQLAGEHLYREVYVIGAGGVLYMLLSTLQALWQAVHGWLFLNRVKGHGFEHDGLPDVHGGVAWTLYGAKMAVITATSAYALWKFLDVV